MIFLSLGEKVIFIYNFFVRLTLHIFLGLFYIAKKSLLIYLIIAWNYSETMPAKTKLSN